MRTNEKKTTTNRPYIVNSIVSILGIECALVYKFANSRVQYDST